VIIPRRQSLSHSAACAADPLNNTIAAIVAHLVHALMSSLSRSRLAPP